jgi:hypothetical protein
MTKSYSYLKAGSFYFSLEQNVLALIWRLYRRGKPFVPDSRPRHRLLRPFSSIVRLSRVLRFALPYLKVRYGSARRLNFIRHLPVSGQIVFPLRKGGYKVFDLQRGVVVTLFPSEADVATVEDAIDRMRSIGRHDFAPEVRQWHVEERWCEETYINGARTQLLKNDWRVFDMTYRSLIEAIILAEPPKRVALHTYVEAQQTIFTREAEIRSASWFDEIKVARVRNFVMRMSEQICRCSTGELGLSFSHGDLTRGNTLICSGQPFIIDWDTGGFRNALHDVHFCFLMMLNPGKNQPELTVLAAKLDQALAQVRATVAEARPDVAAMLFPSTLPEEAHRWLFYIEHISLLVEELLQTTNEAHRLGQLLTHLDIFEKFEALSSAKNAAA